MSDSISDLIDGYLDGNLSTKRGEALQRMERVAPAIPEPAHPRPDREELNYDR